MKTDSNPYNRGGPGKLRQHCWMSGPDLVDHDKFIKWHKHRSQAAFRGEPHDITFEQWQKIWRDPLDWHNRGYQVDCVCLVMISPQLGWTMSNVELVTRAEQLHRQGLMRIGKKRGPYKKRQAK